jgi:hypothetical protein
VGSKGHGKAADIGEEEMITRRLFFGLLAFSLFFCGCGYTTRSMVSTKYRTIYITPFVNKVDITRDADTENKYRVYRPLLESDVTKSVISKYLFDGNLRPVDLKSADLILKAEVVDFRRDVLRYTDNNTVEEYRINIAVNMSLWDNNNEQLWEEKGFTGYADYFVTGISAKSEDSAVSDAITDLSRRIVDRTVEVW